MQDWTGADWIAVILIAWFALALGVALGWLALVAGARRRAERRAARERTARERDPVPSPRTQAMPAVNRPAPPQTSPDFRRPPPELQPQAHPLRRSDDIAGAPARQPLPGGRRRSDGPPMTRAEARRLREHGYSTDSPEHARYNEEGPPA